METITWAEDKAWMLEHWWIFVILFWFMIVLVIWAFVKGAHIPKEAVSFNEDFSSDFKKEPLVEQGRDVQKKYDTFKLFFTWPIELWKWIKRHL